MKLKLTLLSLAITSAFAGSVQAQTLTKEFYDAKGTLNTNTYRTFTNTGVIQAWGRGFTGQGVRIAVLDSGFDLTHTDLQGQVASAKNFNQASLNQIAANTNNIRSQLQGGYDITWGYHGTQMSSIIAGRANNIGAVGVAPGAQLLLAQIGEGVRFNTSTKAWTYNDAGLSMTGVYSALRWAEANGAVAANMSFGSTYDKTFQGGVKLLSTGLYLGPANYGSMYGNRTTDLMNFVNASKSMVLVAAAGNQGLPYAQFPGAFATQTDKDGNLLLGGRVLIVGSVNSSNIISSFSNRAGSFCTNLVGTTCNDKYYVKDFFVVAPGEAIISSQPNQIKTGNQTFPSTGTSPATAIVSGGVALIKNAWPQLTAAQIVHLVKTTATDLTINPTTKVHDPSLVGVDHIYGHGLVNFDRATQPQGMLRIASFKGYGLAGTSPLTGTGVTTSGSAGIGGSSVLKNVQGLDSYDRHYTLDMTRAQVANPIATYRASSSYLAMSPQGYGEVFVPVNENYSFKVMQSSSGSATEVTYSENGASYSLQYGSMTEKSGFLGNYGTGMMSFGDSSTTYLQLGAEHKFGDVAVFGSYGMGMTRAGSVQDSMIQLGNRIASDTWRLGVAKTNVLQSKDSVSLSVVSPVSVRRGSATVTAVTGYEFNDNGDGADARAIVSTETVSLRAQTKPMDLVLGYTVVGTNLSRVNINVARQFNVGGQSGYNSTGVNVVFNKFF